MKSLIIWMQTHYTFIVWTTKTPSSSTRMKCLTLKVCSETMITKSFHSKRECRSCTEIGRLLVDSQKWLKRASQIITSRQLLSIRRKTCWQWFHSFFMKPGDLTWETYPRHISSIWTILTGQRLSSSRLHRSRKLFAQSIQTMLGPLTTTIESSWCRISRTHSNRHFWKPQDSRLIWWPTHSS